MTTAEYLETLIDCKEDMKAALQEKGVTVTGGLTSYADAINLLELGLGDVTVIYVPLGISFGFEKSYSPDGIYTYYYDYPDKLAFDITDNPDFKLDGKTPQDNDVSQTAASVAYTVQNFIVAGRNILMVDFKY